MTRYTSRIFTIKPQRLTALLIFMFCQYCYEPIVCAVTSCLVPKPGIWQLKWRISVADLSLFIRGQNVSNFPNTGIFAWIMSCTYYILNKGKKFNFYFQFSLGYFAPKIVQRTWFSFTWNSKLQHPTGTKSFFTLISFLPLLRILEWERYV